ncbi:peptidoglycan-binding protein [Kosakonia sp. H02]|nr:peptidoglycan-binding protein [Kosakonia sp. H02]
MNQHKYHQPRVFRLSSTVGECGFNDPGDVKALQIQIKNAGYSQGTGRIINTDGQCIADTLEAIRWFQRLVGMPASGLVYPTDMWFMEALENATSMRWRERHTGGPLQVQEGQLTFDYEGVDYITAVEPFRQPARMPWFSRILHHPSSDSGVTLGRGYDMKKRSAGSILYMLR